MDLNESIIEILKSENIRKNIHPINYYILKGIYSKKFYKRSKYFVDALLKVYDSFSNNIDISIFDETQIIKNDDNDITLNNLNITNLNDNSYFQPEKKQNNLIRGALETSQANLNHFSMLNESVIFDINNMKQKDFKEFNINARENDMNFNETQNEIFSSDRRPSNYMGKENDNLNISINKYNYVNLSSKLEKNPNFFIDFILNYYDEHILDKEDNYTLLQLIKNYIFSDEDASNSTLLMTYSLFGSSLELIFCLKQAEKIPNIICTPKEKKFIVIQNEKIKIRIRNFYSAWLNISENRKKLELKKNEILRMLLDTEFQQSIANNSTNEQSFYLLLTTFANPELEKYITITKMIKEQTPFYFNTDELSRQICLIDHELFCRIKLSEFSNFIVKQKFTEIFEIFRIRELQFKCYILCLYYKQDYLDKKKELIRNLIILAKKLKEKKNFQSCFTLVSVLVRLDIESKEDIWVSLKTVEKKVYKSLKEEYKNLENNSGIYQINNFVNPNFNTMNNNSNSSEGFESVPNINLLINIINYFSNVFSKFSLKRSGSC